MSTEVFHGFSLRGLFSVQRPRYIHEHMFDLQHFPVPASKEGTHGSH